MTKVKAKSSILSKIVVSFFIIVLFGEIGIICGLQKVLQRILTESQLSEDIINSIFSSFILTSSIVFFLVIIVSLLLSYWLAYHIISPLSKLREEILEVSKGERQTIKIRTNDEIRDLAIAFNQMIRDLAKAQDRLKQHNKILEQEVKKKTKELRQALLGAQKDRQELEKQRLAIFNILEDVYESQEKLKASHQALKKRSHELASLKSLGDELVKILNIEGAIEKANQYLAQIARWQIISYIIFKPAEQKQVIYQIYFNQDIDRQNFKNAQVSLKNYLSKQKFPNSSYFLQAIKKQPPQIFGEEKYLKPKKSSESFNLFFPVRIGSEVLGVVQLTTTKKNADLVQAKKDFIEAIIISFALAVDRLHTLFKAQHSKTASLVTSLRDGVVMFDKDKEIILVNPAFYKYTNLVSKNLSLASIDNLFENINLKKTIAEVWQTNKLAHIQEAGLRGLTFEIFITPVRDNKNQIVGGAIILHDITYLKEIDRLKSEFISIASHQLRTPLTSIKLFTEILLNENTDNFDAQQKQYLANIYQATNNMAHLVNDLLNLSRIEAGKITPVPEKVELAPFLTQLIGEVEALAKEKNVHLEFKKPKNKIIAYFDTNLLRQVINNLLTNAIRYSRSGSGLVQLKVRRTADKQIVISVQDNGIGIPAAVKQRIFDKFYRADNAVKAAPDGTGLGLYTAKMIIERMGGKIWFRSKEKEGTTFYVKIPI